MGEPHAARMALTLATTTNLLESPEANQRTWSVPRLYFAYFLRRPDHGGLRTGGTGCAEARPASAASPPPSRRLRSSPRAANRATGFVRRYRNVLGRELDQSGLDFWTDQLESGTRTRGQGDDRLLRVERVRPRHPPRSPWSSSTRPCSAVPERDGLCRSSPLAAEGNRRDLRLADPRPPSTPARYRLVVERASSSPAEPISASARRGSGRGRPGARRSRAGPSGARGSPPRRPTCAAERPRGAARRAACLARAVARGLVVGSRSGGHHRLRASQAPPSGRRSRWLTRPRLRHQAADRGGRPLGDAVAGLATELGEVRPEVVGGRRRRRDQTEPPSTCGGPADVEVRSARARACELRRPHLVGGHLGSQRGQILARSAPAPRHRHHGGCRPGAP